MAPEYRPPALLGRCRVLDLSDEQGLFCGKVLADLGADVIKIERPGGDAARNAGPFFHDSATEEQSLFWFAYNTNKRGVTLNIDTPDGQDILRRLASDAHFVLESFPPGYMERMGLGYPQLSRINPGIIVTSITPYGQSGPYSTHRGSDITIWAMGGVMYLTGDADRPPLRPSVEQAYLHAGAHAAAGTLIAHYYRETTGEGQHVDVSIHEGVLTLLHIEAIYWESLGYLSRREGPRRHRAAITQRDVWPCKDGHLGWRLLGGLIGARTNRALVSWMAREGMAGELGQIRDWEKLDLGTVTQEQADAWEELIRRFLLQHTKAEIAEEVRKERMHITPGSTPAELFRYAQLVDRGFWEEVAYPELGTTITHPGPFCRLSGIPRQPPRRAPRIGEHNQDIYEKELGFSQQEHVLLREAGVI